MLLILHLSVMGQNDSIEKSPFHFGVTYLGDVVNNLEGGIKKGTNYLGFGCIEVGFKSNKTKLWKNGELIAKIGNTHGGEPSATLVGDFMGVSNIEAGDLTFLYEFKYHQKTKNLEISAGLQDLNLTYAYSTYGSFLNNSSFGIQSSISDNIPTPVFPLTALGAGISWKIFNEITFQTALYDGTPDQYGSNPFDIKWKINKYDGFLSISEFKAEIHLAEDLQGSYKVGYYYHEHKDTSLIHIQNNYGFYLNIDQLIIKNKSLDGGLAIFSQLGISPRTKNAHNHFYSIGLEQIGIGKKRPVDIIGIAIAYAGFDNIITGNETTIELAYKAILFKQLAIKPDIQYIINPAGTHNKLKNALVATLRIELVL